MSARYWVLASDELMAPVMAGSSLPWPDGLRPVRKGPVESWGLPAWTGPESPQSPVPLMRWWLFEDDDALPSLEGTRAELAIGNVDGKAVIMGRRPAL